MAYQKGHQFGEGNMLPKIEAAIAYLYDRLKRKYVVDYFSFGVRWKWLSRIVFNLSDFGIMIGAMMPVKMIAAIPR